MAQNFIVDLIAGLDQGESRARLNGEIDKLKGQLNEIKLTAKLDTKEISNVQKQLSNLQITLENVKVSDAAINNMVSQLNRALNSIVIQIPNLNINTSNITTQAQKSGEQIGKNLGDSINKNLQSSLNSVKASIDSTMKSFSNQKLNSYDLSKMFNLNRSNIDSSVIQKVRNLTNEINALSKEAVKTNSDTAWEGITQKISSLSKVLTQFGTGRDLSSFKESLDVLDYFQNKKIFVGNKADVLANTGMTVKELNNQFRNLGVTFTTVSEGATKLDTIWSELFKVSPNLQQFTNFGDQISAIVNHLKIAKEAMYGDSSLRPLNEGEVTKVLVDYLEKLENTSNKMRVFQSEQAEIESRIAQASTNATNTVIQNEQKKQQAYEKTAQTKSSASHASNSINSIIQQGNVANLMSGTKESILKELNSISGTIVTVKDKIRELNGQPVLEGFTANVKNAKGEMEALVYEADKISGLFKYTGGTINDAGALKQMNAISAKADELQIKLDKLKARYSDINSSKPIKNPENISALSQQYDKVTQAIQGVRNADSITFASMVTNAQKEITTLENMVSQFKNAETVATQLKGTDIASGIAQAQERFEKLKANASTFSQMKSTIDELSVAMSNVGDKSSLDNFINKLKVAESELQKVKAESKAMQTMTNIKLSVGENGNITTQLDVLSNGFKKVGLSSDEVMSKMQGVTTEYNTLKALISSGASESAIVQQYNKLNSVLKQTQNDLKQTRSEYSLLATTQQRLTLANTIEKWNQKNTAATKQVIQTNEQYIASLRDLNTQMTLVEKNNIVNSFKQTENAMRGMGKLGLALKDQWKQMTSSFSMWISASTAVMKVISETRQAFTEMKNIDTLLTEISKTDWSLTSSDLKQIGSNAFSVASDYGKTATDYLSGVKDMSRAGYDNAEAMAELSVSAQGAGDMTADVANKMIIATDKAYKMGGSVEELTKVLDGVNWICDNNATTMTDLSEAMSIVGSTAASTGVGVNQLTAALGTMSATTQQSGSEVARAFKAILLNIKQVSDADEGVDAEGLTKYEKACNALGVSLKETKDGILQTRDAMQVLEDLSNAYNQLDKNDVRRVNLLSSVGGKLRSTQLDALLTHFQDTYKPMLEQFATGQGTMAVEAEKTSKSWEGSMNRLSNTFTSTMSNMANSDAIITLTNDFNGLLTVVNNITKSLGSMGSIGLISGLVTGIKNIGLIKTVEPTQYNGLGVAKNMLSINAQKLATQELNAMVAQQYAEIQADTIALRNLEKAVSDGVAYNDAYAVSMKNASASAQEFAMSTQGAAGSTDVFKGKQEASLATMQQSTRAISGMSTAFQTFSRVAWSMILFTGIAKGIELASTAIDNYIHRVEKANEAMKTAVSEYDSTKSELENVNSELESNKQQIDELQSKGQLTYVEKGQLEELKEITRQLELQQNIQEKEVESKRRESAEKAVDAYNKQFGNSTVQISDEGIKQYLDDIKATGGHFMDTGKNDIAANLANFVTFNDELTKSKNMTKDTLDAYQKIVEDSSKNITDGLSSLSEQKSALQDEYNYLIDKQANGSTLTQSEQSIVSIYESIVEKIMTIYKYFDPTKYREMQVSNIFDTKGIEVTKEQLVSQITGMVDDVDNALGQEYARLENWNIPEEYAQKIKDGTMQTMFGNVDMDKRTVITWTEQMKQAYADALSSWNYNPEVGSTDSVFGQSERFGKDLDGKGWEIAFTPILSDGTFLNKDTVEEYINGILEEAYADDGKVTDSELKELDQQGRQIGNQFVQGIYAGVDDSLNYSNNGNSAKLISRMMNFSGDYGTMHMASVDVIQQLLGKYPKLTDAMNEEGVTVEELASELNSLAFNSQTVSGKVDGMTVSFKSLNDVLASEDFKDVKEELAELAKSGELSPDTLASVKEYRDLLNETGLTAEEAYSQLKESLAGYFDMDLSDWQDQFTNARESISSLQDILQDIKENKGKLSNDSVDTLISDYPQLVQYMGNVAELQTQINSLIGEQSTVANDAYSAMLEFNSEAYNQILRNSDDLLEGITIAVNGEQKNLTDYLASAYNIDLNNFSNLAQAKAQIESALIGDLGKAWKDYYNIVYDDVTGMGKVTSNLSDFMNSNTPEANEARDKLATYNETITRMDAQKKKIDSFQTPSINIPKPSASTKTPSSSKSSGGSSSEKEQTALEKFQDWFSTLFDWIEIKLERQTDKIDAYTKRADRQKDSGKYSDATTSDRKAIDATTTQIGYETTARDKYNAQAEKVLAQSVAMGVINQSNADSIRKNVQNGTMNIYEYSDEIQEVIKDYQEWYDKSKDASDAISELHDNIRTYISDLKDLRDAQRDAKLDKLDSSSTIGGSTTSNTANQEIYNLRYANKLIDKKNNAYTTEVNNVSKDSKKIGKTASSALKKQNAGTDEKYKKALSNAQKAIKSKKKISGADLKVIQQHSQSAYEKAYAYNLSVDNVETVKFEKAVSLAENISERYSNTASINQKKNDKVNDKISLLNSKASNKNSTSGKLSTLDKVSAQYDAILKNDTTAINAYGKRIKSAKKTINKTNGSAKGALYKSADKKTRTSVSNLITKVRKSVKKGEAISGGDLSKLADYYSKGYISKDFYASCLKYNNALDGKNQAIAQKEIDAQTAIQEKQSIAEQKVQAIQDKYTEKDTKTNSKIDLIESKVSNANTAKDKNKLLDSSLKQYNTIVTNDQKEVNEYNKKIKSNAKTIQKGAGTSVYKNAGKKTKKNVKSTLTEVRKLVKSNKEISDSLMDKLAGYYKNGYITSGFYEACINYNQNLLAKQSAEEQLEIDKQTQIAKKTQVGTEKIENIEQEYTNKQNVNNTAKNKLSTSQNYKTTRGNSLTYADYKDLISNSQEEQKIYEDEVKAMQKQIDQNIKDGLWSTESQAYKDAVQSMEDYANKAEECKVEQGKWNNSIAQLPYERLNKAVEKLDAIKSNIDAQIALEDTKGAERTSGQYQAQLEQLNEKLKVLQQEREQKAADYWKSMESEDGTYGGQTTEDLYKDYVELDTEIINLNKDIVDVNNSLGNLPTEQLKSAIELIDIMKSNIESIISLNNEKGLDTTVKQYQDLIDKTTEEAEKKNEEKLKYLTNYGMALAEPDQAYNGMSANEWLEEFYKADTELQGYYKDIESYKNAIVQIPYTELEDDIQHLEKIKSNLDSLSAIDEARGVDKTVTQFEKDNAKINEQIDAYTKEKEMKWADYNKAVSNSEGVYGGKKAEEILNEYYDIDTKINDLRKDIIENNNEMANIPFEKLDKELDMLDALKSNYQSLLDIEEAMGSKNTVYDYQKLISYNNDQIALNESKKDEAWSNYQKALKEKDTVYGGKTSDEWLQEYYEYDTTINDLTKDTIEYNNAILNMPIDTIETALELIQNIKSNFESLLDIQDAMGIDRTQNDYLKQIEYANQQIEQYEQERQIAYDNYQKALGENNLAYAGHDADYWLNQYYELDTNINNVKKDVVEANNAIAQMPIDKIEESISYLETILSDYEALLGIKDTLGADRTESDYLKQVEYSQQILKQYGQERAIALSNYQKAMADSNGVYGGHDADYWADQYYKLDTEVNNTTKDIIEANNAIAQMPLDRISEALDLLGAIKSDFESILSIKEAMGIDKTRNDYIKQMEYNSQQMAQYEQERYIAWQNYNKALADSNGTYGGHDANYWKQQYYEFDTEVNNAKKDIVEANNAIAQMPYDSIEKATDKIKSFASYYDSYFDLVSAMGYDLEEEDYFGKVQNNNEQIQKYTEQQMQSYSDYQKALADTNGVYGGKTADEYLQIYYEAGTEINNLKANNEELKDSLRDDVYWRTFERAHDAAQRFGNVLSGVGDLIDDDMMFDKDGKLTEFGTTHIANLVGQYENAREEVQNYSNDLDNLNALYSAGYYTQEEYNEKLAEIQEGMLNSASSMKSYINDIKNTYKEMEQSELDNLMELIDLRNEALSAKKSYYEYDKTIRDKNKDIQAIQAQISALEGISTAEAKAKRASLEADLAEQQEDLNDTINEHMFELSQDSLDALKTTLQDSFDDRWTDISTSLDKIAELMATANDLTQSSSATIESTLNALLSSYGIDASDISFRGYASGTKCVDRDRLAWTNENGNEMIIRASDGAILTPLKQGDIIPNANLSANLFEWGKINPQNLLQDLTQNMNIPVPENNTGDVTIAPHYDALLKVEGNVDKNALPELKEILKQSYEYTTKEIARDARKVGLKVRK